MAELDKSQGTSVTILDQMGEKSVAAVIGDYVPISCIIANIIKTMELAETSPDGKLLSYVLNHKEGRRRLLESWTLVEAGVQNGDHLIVYPEVVAGERSIEYLLEKCKTLEEQMNDSYITKIIRIGRTYEIFKERDVKLFYLVK